MNQQLSDGSRTLPVSLPGKKQLAALFVPCLVCFYLIVTSTVSVYPELPVYDVKRGAEFLLLFVAILATLLSSRLRFEIASQAGRLPRFVVLGILLFFSLGIASSITNAESLRGLIYSLIDVSLLGLLLVLTLIIAACRTIAGIHFDRVVIALITFMGLAVGVQELTGFWAAWSIGLSYNFDVALIHFSFPRMYNHLQTWTIPILGAVPFLFPRYRIAAVFCILALGLHWYILLVTGARGSIVSLLVAMTLISIISPAARKANIKWQTPGILLGLLLYTGLFAATVSDHGNMLADGESLPPGKQQTTVNQTVATQVESPVSSKPNTYYERSVGRPMLHTSGRSRLWREAVSDAMENPLLGIGPMNFACKGPAGRVGSPHNLVFQFLSEWGIPATLVLVLLGFSLLWFLFVSLKAPLNAQNNSTVLRALLITAVFAALVHLMVSSLLLTPASQIAAALIAGWLIGIVPHRQLKTRPKWSAALLSGALLCTSLTLAFALHEMVKMPSYRQQLPAVEEGRPRFWQLGKACSSDLH